MSGASVYHVRLGRSAVTIGQQLARNFATISVELLKPLGAVWGMATLFVMQDNRIPDSADRVLTLEDGRIFSNTGRA